MPGLQSSHWEIPMIPHFSFGKYFLTRDIADKSRTLEFLLGNRNMASPRNTEEYFGCLTKLLFLLLLLVKKLTFSIL